MKIAHPIFYFTILLILLNLKVFSCVKIDSLIVTNSNYETTGSIRIITSGGLGPFEYSIDGGATMQGSNYFEDLNAGSYDVVVIDANFCTAYQQVKLTESYQLDMSLRKTGNQLISNIERASFRWFDCNKSDVPIAGESKNYFTASKSGSYMVEAMTYKCLDTSQCYRIDVLHHSNIHCKYRDIKVHYVQDGGFLINTNVLNDVNFKVFNIWGSEADFRIKTNHDKSLIYINEPKGIYILNSNRYSIKVLKP